MNVWTYSHLNDDTYIPEYVFVGHVEGHPWTFVYYDKDKIKEELEKQVAKKFGYSRDNFYWDEDDTGAVLFSEEIEYTQEEFENGDDDLAYFNYYEIQDAWEYVDELRKEGVIK